MMNGKEAVDLLLANTVQDADEKSRHIDQYNEDRRELDKRITDEANVFIDENIDIESKNSIVIYNEHWHKGVIGIVASRLTEKYLRPTVVLTKSNDLITGSARSVMGFDIYRAIEECKDLLENFGGHTYAAGLSLKEENYREFRRRFEALSVKMMEPEMMSPQIHIDAELKLSEIDNKFISDLSRFAPFGPDNLNPIFMSRNVIDNGTAKLVGKDNLHIKLELIDETMHYPLHGIAFRQKKSFDIVKESKPFDICYTLEENIHRGKKNIQLYIKDIETRLPNIQKA
jgi:single-stranded-DNA-specific exonuclease